LPFKQAAREETRKLDVFVASANDMRFAVVVDALLDERDAIIKDIGLPGSKSGLAAGAIPLDDGAVAVVLNVPELFLHRDKGAPSKTFLIAEPKKKTASILVVDDSLTTRSLERSILEAHGYKVRVTVDGLQALEQIRLEKPDLVISDVMMPRMTGFELLDQIKGDASIKDLPVILVTSLESREEQGRGLELGADAYIVKNRFDQGELLRIVRQIV
jgi:two-component system chemotaxis sensor kinase CheA